MSWRKFIRCSKDGTFPTRFPNCRFPVRRAELAELPLDGFPKILQQMKAINDLPRLRRPLARACGIEPGAVAADNLNLGMRFEPFGG